LALSDALVDVKLEKPGRCFSFVGQRLDDCSSKYEVILPTMKSRVEETEKPSGMGVNRSNISALPNIASQAGIGQVARL